MTDVKAATERMGTTTMVVLKGTCEEWLRHHPDDTAETRVSRDHAEMILSLIACVEYERDRFHEKVNALESLKAQHDSDTATIAELRAENEKCLKIIDDEHKRRLGTKGYHDVDEFYKD